MLIQIRFVRYSYEYELRRIIIMCDNFCYIIIVYKEDNKNK